MQMSIWLPPESSQSTDIKEILKKKLNKDKRKTADNRSSILKYRK